jgi:acetyl-CoA C-acetyltransferase
VRVLACSAWPDKLSDEVWHELKQVITRIAWKNHRNGALDERARFRSEVPMEKIACSPIVAGQLGVFDCCERAEGWQDVSVVGAGRDV